MSTASSPASKKLVQSTADDQEDVERRTIRVSIPRELYLIPLATTATGLGLGFLRGSRTASLRFLAENVHRAPRTVEEWYFYHKTKNYRVFLGGLKQAGRDGVRIGATGVVWVGLEQAARGVGLDDYRELCAGSGLAAGVAALYRLPRQTALQVGLLGVVGGGLMAVLRRTRTALGTALEGSETAG